MILTIRILDTTDKTRPAILVAQFTVAQQPPNSTDFPTMEFTAPATPDVRKATNFTILVTEVREETTPKTD